MVAEGGNSFSVMLPMVKLPLFKQITLLSLFMQEAIIKYKGPRGTDKKKVVGGACWEEREVQVEGKA